MYSITLDEFKLAYKRLSNFRRKTKLEKYNDNIFLKKESNQISGSFKWSGVLYAVMKAFDKLLITNKVPSYVVTQSTGNHGIAMIKAVNFLIDDYKRKYPKCKKLLNNIIPIIFTNKNVKDFKLKMMNKEILLFKKNHNKLAYIDNSSSNYEESLNLREEFLKNNNGIYIEHGGKDILTGYGSIAFEINDQIEKNKKLSLYVTVGAGGPIGIGLCLSYLRDIDFYIVQTKSFDAFIRSLNNNSLEINKNNENILVSDGIAVDKPEKFSLEIARKIVKKCITVNKYDVLELYNKNNLGYSTCITLLGYHKNLENDKNSINIILDCEKRF